VSIRNSTSAGMENGKRWNGKEAKGEKEL
jgi:hypothetical protein